MAPPGIEPGHFPRQGNIVPFNHEALTVPQINAIKNLRNATFKYLSSHKALCKSGWDIHSSFLVRLL